MTGTEEEVAVETSGDSFGCLSAARAKAVTKRSPAVARVDRVKRGKEIIENSWVFLSSASLGPVTVFALLTEMHVLNRAASLTESTDYYVAKFRAMTEKLYLTAPLV
jgi:hypothetical protein